MTSINESAIFDLACEDDGTERETRRALHRAVRYSAGLTTFVTSQAFFLTGMDTMIVNVALPTITADLGGDMALQQWMIDGYTLLFASLLLLAGSLSDKFGAKRMFFFGTALFGAASLLSTFAWTMLVLIVGRCLMGVAAALILPASMALINEANPDPRRRAFALGLWGAGSASASAFGPLFGGLLTPIHWSLIFAVNVPFCLIVLALAPKVAPSPTRAISFGRIGQTLALIGLAALVAGVIEIGSLGISSPVTIALLAVGLAALVLFVLAQAKVRHPMVPLSLFRNDGMRISLIVGFIMIFNWFGMVFISTLFLQGEQGMSPFAAGLVFVPSAVVMVLTNVFSGQVINAMGTRFAVSLGLIAMAVGFLAAVLVPAPMPAWVIAAALSVVGLGGALVTPALSGLVLVSVDQRQAGIASAVFNTFRQVGGAIGVAVFGVVATFMSSLDGSLRAVFIAAAVLLVISFAYARLRWCER
ncbi:MFS transporter [Bifidobacterium stellenboschense]|uniref:Transporter, major facilitator family protein n=1 Tax=Bifidobacterium stellenboschense TaxID=762211 RepID=A0A087DMW1_9BIFI|nr:MFS transporter [Bifidobacterium stellenboschense]KFI96861.1 transporter, major facilitator family protein [Bifidobacterium stellenboschense]